MHPNVCEALPEAAHPTMWEYSAVVAALARAMIPQIAALAP